MESLVVMEMFVQRRQLPCRLLIIVSANIHVSIKDLR